MGNCIKSKPLPDNTFLVRVINDGRKLEGQIRGRLQVTETNIILTLLVGPQNKIEWPLRHLRKYGCEGNIFSIQAGSKCQTGEGTFAFRTDHAQELFELVAKIVSNRQQLEASSELDIDNNNNNSTSVSSPPAINVQKERSVDRSTSKQPSPASPPDKTPPPAIPDRPSLVISDGRPSGSGGGSNSNSLSPTKHNLNYPELVLAEPSSNGVVPTKRRVSYTTMDFKKTDELHEQLDHQHGVSNSNRSPTMVSGSTTGSYANLELNGGPPTPGSANATAVQYNNMTFHNGVNTSSGEDHSNHAAVTNHNYDNWKAPNGNTQANSYSNMTFDPNGKPDLNYLRLNFPANQGQPAENGIGSSNGGEAEGQHSRMVFREDTSNSDYSKLDIVATTAIYKVKKEQEEDREKRRLAIPSAS